MSELDALSSDGTLRRIRSTGDIPRRPERIHISSGFRYSESRSEPRDQPIRSDNYDQNISAAHHLSSSAPSGVPLSAGLTPTRTWASSPPATAHSDGLQIQSPRPSTSARISVPENHPHLPRQHNRSLYARTMSFFGYGRGASRARRSLIALFWNLSWGMTQIIVIIVLLSLSGTHFKSPTNPNTSEWTACNRPLGIWGCLWIVRLVLASSLTYWGFLRDRQSLRRSDEIEHGASDAAPSNSPASSRIGANITSTHSMHRDAHPTSTAANSRDPPILPHTLLYSRLSLLSSMLTLSWFLTAHILQYTSVNTCRHSSPHVWWLTFGILCTMYLMVLEVLLLGFVVFIIAPILFVIWNIFLICIGRHPLQNPSMIKPEIGKLSKSIVDQIPLVMYIPPPPDSSTEEKIPVPQPAYSYPPKPSPSQPVPSKSRFRFFKTVLPFKKKSNTQPENSKSNEGEEPNEEPQTWERHWEQGEYPFVILEGNRAACAICLMDFEEPNKRTNIVNASSNEPKNGTSEPNAAAPTASSAEPITVEARDPHLKLTDAGDGAQPLRLLACGHVFHKTCLDPWLTDVSGRCPVCQRAVTVPDLPKKKSRNSRRRNV